MKNPSPNPAPPSQPQAVFASLLQKLGEAGRAPKEVPASPATPEALAVALFDVAGSTGVALFSVWAEQDAAGQGEDRAQDDPESEPRIRAGITFFYVGEDSPERMGLLGSERQPVRQPMAPELYRPLGQALAAHAKRGQDARRPDRGSVTHPWGAQDPDVVFRVGFRDGALGTWTTAEARGREARAAYPPVRDLPLAADAADFLEDLFWSLKSLFNGRVVLFTGGPRTGRSTSLRAALNTLPDNLHVLVASEDPKAGAGAAIGQVRVGGELPLSQVVRSFLRQDPDLVFADEVRTVEDMTMLCTAALTGHGVACVLEAKTPDEAQAWLNEALPGASVLSLIVHHERDAADGRVSVTLHEGIPADDGRTVRVAPWKSGG